MNLDDLATHLSGEHDLPKAKVKRLLDAAFTAIGETVARGEEVSLPGFGKFKAADRPAREGRNPATGETIQIAASRKASFAPAKVLKDKLAGTQA